MTNNIITVPVSQCTQYQHYVRPFTNEDRLHSLTHALTNKLYVEPAIGFYDNNEFVIISNWDVIHVARQLKIETVSIILGTFTDRERLHYSIFEASNKLSLNWFRKALAVTGAQKGMKLNNTRMAKITPLSRSMISRYNLIEQRLHPTLYSVANAGKLTYDAARLLITLQSTEQSTYLSTYQHNYSAASVKEYIDILRPSHSRDQSNNPPATIQKSNETLRAEETLSETLGHPIELDLNGDQTKGGVMGISFFNKDELMSIIESLQDCSASSLAGSIAIEFKDNNDFLDVTDAFFPKDEF